MGRTGAKESDDATSGKLLQRYRHRAGLTQEELADALAHSISTLPEPTRTAVVDEAP